MKVNNKKLKEMSDVDFFVDPKPLTKADIKKISDFIKADKEKRKKQRTNRRKTYAHANR